jgi:hypothetical protein
MSKLSFRPRGGCEGIEFTRTEQLKLCYALASEFADEFVPLPNVTIEEQVARYKDGTNDDDDSNCIYWETETGSHGWCNPYNGRVVQWG